MKFLLSLNFWIGVFSVSAIAGIGAAITGTFMEMSWLRTLGFVLIAPIVLSGILLVCVGIPILIVANRKAEK